jgi:hypothetical protein
MYKILSHLYTGINVSFYQEEAEPEKIATASDPQLKNE